jgi:glycerol-3-phosphate cytidylyltransferase-like family protein
MTCSILTPGHIKCLEILEKKGGVVVGLLSSKALKGYKREVVPFKDRKFILDKLSKSIGNMRVIRQDSLNPFDNLKAYDFEYMASGDGFEQSELDAMESLGVKRINLKLPKETKKRWSSSSIFLAK